MARLISVKDCVSQAAQELGLVTKPVASVVGTADQDISQMLALLSLVADETLLEEPYRATLGDGVWVVDQNGLPKPAPTTDSDFILFDSRLAINGLKYRFLKSKGLEYGEEMRDYTNRMNKLSGRVNGRVLDLDSDEGRLL
jgi:hypothetical protein